MNPNTQMKPKHLNAPTTSNAGSVPAPDGKGIPVAWRGRHGSRNAGVKTPGAHPRFQHSQAQRLTVPEVLARIPVTPALSDEVVRELLCLQIEGIHDLWSGHVWCDYVRGLGGPDLGEAEVWAIRAGTRAITSEVRAGVAVYQTAFARG